MPKKVGTKVRGQDIVSLHTLKSWYDGDSIAAVLDDGKVVRIQVCEILKILNGYYFDAEVKRKGGHTYLINPEDRSRAV